MKTSYFFYPARLFNLKQNALAVATFIASLASSPAVFALDDVSGFNADNCGVGSCGFTDNGNYGEVTLSKNNSTVSFDKFSIQNGQRVDFNGASAGWALLVNVTGGKSIIQGDLGGNVGRLVFVNSNGIVFDGANIIDIKQLIATTGTINDFGTPQYLITDIKPNSSIEVRGQGLTLAATGAQLALIAGDIDISGQVTVSAGDFIAAVGGEVAVSFDNSGLMRVDITQELEKTGTAIYISSTGEITAQNIELNADITSDPFSLALNHRGVLKATGFSNEGGVIKIVGKGTQVLSLGAIDTSDANGNKAGRVEIDAAVARFAGKTKTDSLAVSIGEGEAEGRIQILENQALDFDVNRVSITGLGNNNTIDGMANYVVNATNSGTAAYEGIGTNKGDYTNIGAVTFTNVSKLSSSNRTNNVVQVTSDGRITGHINGGSGSDGFLIQGYVEELNTLGGSDTIVMDGGFIQALDGGGGDAVDSLQNVFQPNFNALLGSSGSGVNVANWTNIEHITEAVTPLNVSAINVPQNPNVPVSNLGSTVLGLVGVGDELKLPCGFGSKAVGVDANVNIDKPDCYNRYNTPKYQQLISSLIHFDNDSYAITPDSMVRLNKISDFVVESQMFDQVVLSGHTDNNASHNYNLRLSKKRVNAASAYLQDQGVDADILKTHAFGETLPVKLNDSVENRAYNRRVHIELKK